MNFDASALFHFWFCLYSLNYAFYFILFLFPAHGRHLGAVVETEYRTDGKKKKWLEVVVTCAHTSAVKLVPGATKSSVLPTAVRDRP